jgi:hypothetical protein
MIKMASADGCTCLKLVLGAPYCICLTTSLCPLSIVGNHTLFALPCAT